VKKLSSDSRRALLALVTPRNERQLVAVVSAAMWAASTVTIEALSFVHGLAPSNPNPWRLGLGIPSALFVATILVVAPRLTPRALQRAQIFVWGLAMAVLLFITPATFAVLINLFVVALVVAYQASRRAAFLQLLASAGFALHPLHGSTVDELVRRADDALMAVKRDGKHAVRVSAAG